MFAMFITLIMSCFTICNFFKWQSASHTQTHHMHVTESTVRSQYSRIVLHVHEFLRFLHCRQRRSQATRFSSEAVVSFARRVRQQEFVIGSNRVNSVCSVSTRANRTPKKSSHGISGLRIFVPVVFSFMSIFRIYFKFTLSINHNLQKIFLLFW